MKLLRLSRRRRAPEPQPLLPPEKLCECGCAGAEHLVVWFGTEFKGTRCAKHGGHKFMFAKAGD